MADPRYEIDWSADLTPALAHLAAARNASKANKRSDEYLQLQREAQQESSRRHSAEVERQKVRDEHARAIETWNAMPTLQRAAMKSVGMANTNPYGVKFDETYEQPDQGKADAEVSNFLNAPPQPESATPAVPRQLLPTEEGPEQAPEAEAARFASTDTLMDRATSGAPLDVMSQAAANSLGAPKRHVSATYQGQHFDIPEQSETTPFGADYDAIYKGMIDSGEDPHKAMQFVASQYKADQTQENIAKRTAANTAALIGGRDASREDQQTFQAQQDAQYRRTYEQALALARAAAARHDPSGGADPATMAALADYAIKNPGDIGGLYRQADALHAPSPGKAVTSVTGATKATESQSKDAKQAAIGLRAIDSIEKANYVPNDKDIQTWLNNQRDVYQAQKAGEGGGISGFLGGKLAGGMQSAGLMAKSEVQGLSPQAQQYFANVRRFMETIGRAQSGAAIANSEWTNFLNQYGPQSPGGLAAARQYMEDQLRASGVAGRSIAPNAPTRAASPSKAGGGDMVTIRNKKTGETKQVTREEAQQMGAL